MSAPNLEPHGRHEDKTRALFLACPKPEPGPPPPPRAGPCGLPRSSRQRIRDGADMPLTCDKYCPSWIFSGTDVARMRLSASARRTPNPALLPPLPLSPSPDIALPLPPPPLPPSLPRRRDVSRFPNSTEYPWTPSRSLCTTWISPTPSTRGTPRDAVVSSSLLARRESGGVSLVFHPLHLRMDANTRHRRTKRSIPYFLLFFFYTGIFIYAFDILYGIDCPVPPRYAAPPPFPRPPFPPIPLNLTLHISTTPPLIHTHSISNGRLGTSCAL